MKLKLVTCAMISREMKAAVSRCANEVEVVLLPAALHREGAAALRDAVQQAIDAAGGACDAVLIGYGLCGNGLSGLRAGAVPLVVPRAHDCIALLMGSRHRYREYFDSHPGVYFLSTGWMEEGAALEPSALTQLSGYELDDLVRKYGDDNGRYLYETLHQYEHNYRQFTFIENGFDQDAASACGAEQLAARRGWGFEKIAGDLRLFHNLVDGVWDPADFLVVPPGKQVVASYDDGILGVEDAA